MNSIFLTNSGTGGKLSTNCFKKICNCHENEETSIQRHNNEMNSIPVIILMRAIKPFSDGSLVPYCQINRVCWWSSLLSGTLNTGSTVPVPGVSIFIVHFLLVMVAPTFLFVRGFIKVHEICFVCVFIIQICFHFFDFTFRENFL